MAYIFLGFAIAMEVLGTSLLAASEGFTRLLPSVGSLLAYAVSFLMLAQVMKQLPVGIVYASWSGLGTVAIVAVGAVVFRQPVNLATIVGVGLVVAGIAILNFGGAH